MKRIKLLFILILISGTASAQLRVKPNGQVEMNGQGGIYETAPHIYINSNETNILGSNSGLTLCNQNATANNTLRLNFSSSSAGSATTPFVGLTAQFVNRTHGSEASNFHISTYDKGILSPKFSMYNSNITSGTNKNSYADFHFMSGINQGIWIGNYNGYPAIYPGANNLGWLGKQDKYWASIFSVHAIHTNHPVIGSADVRKKNSVQNITGTLHKIAQVRGIKYKSNIPSDEIYSGIEKEKMSQQEKEEFAEIVALREKELQKEREKERFGFIAQELIEIFPEVVEYDKENDFYGIQYTALIPILFEGIKEQQIVLDIQNSKIKEQQDINDAQSLKLKELEEKLAKLIKADEKVINIKSETPDNTTIESKNNPLTNAFLYQNIPNPFSTNTEIKYFIPEGVKDAKLFIFSIQGNLLKTEKISSCGHGSIVINGTALTAGIYLYSLVLEGKEIDTKRMILTE